MHTRLGIQTKAVHRCGEIGTSVAGTVPHQPALQLHEEAGVTATAMQHCGLLHFHFDDKPQPWEVHGERTLRLDGCT